MFAKMSVVSRVCAANTGMPSDASRGRMRAPADSSHAMTRSGRRSRMSSNFAVRNALTFGFRRASGGRTVYPDTPTTRSPAPIR